VENGFLLRGERRQFGQFGTQGALAFGGFQVEPVRGDVPFQFLERKVHHIMMVYFFRRDRIAEFEPHSVQDIDLLCQQYVVRSATTDYTIRQPKPSDQTLIPLNTAVQFTLDKNKIKFKVDGKSHEFLVVSQAASSSADPNRQ
jgi:hypothetical protein